MAKISIDAGTMGLSEAMRQDIATIQEAILNALVKCHLIMDGLRIEASCHFGTDCHFSYTFEIFLEVQQPSGSQLVEKEKIVLDSAELDPSTLCRQIISSINEMIRRHQRMAEQYEIRTRGMMAFL